MSSKLSDLTNNLSGIYGKESRGCKERNRIKSVCDLKNKNDKLHYKYNECKKRLFTTISGLIEKFSNTYQFCNNDINKFILLVKRSVYPDEYMDSWERFDKTPLPDKESFL